MLSKAIQSKRRLMSLACSMETFTKAQFVKEYRNSYPKDINVNFEIVAGEFLRDAYLLGIIKKIDGCYMLSERGENQNLAMISTP